MPVVHIPVEPPNLDAPGAGIGTAMTLIARYVWMPVLALRRSEEDALAVFAEEARAIAALLASLDRDELATRVLVPRQAGLEDSSRWWSAALTVEHLLVVNEEIAAIVVALSRGEQPELAEVTTARVKPRAQLDPARTGAEFAAMVARFTDRVAERARPMRRDVTWRHPWFGPMTAHRWLCLAGAHQGLHGRQLQAIAAGLRVTRRRSSG